MILDAAIVYIDESLSWWEIKLTGYLESKSYISNRNLEKKKIVPYKTPSAHTPPRNATSADMSAGIPQWTKVRETESTFQMLTKRIPKKMGVGKEARMSNYTKAAGLKGRQGCWDLGHHGTCVTDTRLFKLRYAPAIYMIEGRYLLLILAGSGPGIGLFIWKRLMVSDSIDLSIMWLHWISTATPIYSNRKSATLNERQSSYWSPTVTWLISVISSTSLRPSVICHPPGPQKVAVYDRTPDYTYLG